MSVKAAAQWRTFLSTSSSKLVFPELQAFLVMIILRDGAMFLLISSTDAKTLKENNKRLISNVEQEGKKRQILKKRHMSRKSQR